MNYAIMVIVFWLECACNKLSVMNWGCLQASRQSFPRNGGLIGGSATHQAVSLGRLHPALKRIPRSLLHKHSIPLNIDLNEPSFIHQPNPKHLLQSPNAPQRRQVIEAQVEIYELYQLGDF